MLVNQMVFHQFRHAFHMFPWCKNNLSTHGLSAPVQGELMGFGQLFLGLLVDLLAAVQVSMVPVGKRLQFARLAMEKIGHRMFVNFTHVDPFYLLKMVIFYRYMCEFTRYMVDT